MEFKAEADPRVALTLDGMAEITLRAPRSALQSLETLKGKELLVKVTIYAKRRSLSQNAYMWTMLGELASKMGITKEEAYRNYIKDYGLYEILPIKNEAVSMFTSNWNSHGLGWICEVLKESKLSGYTNVIAYYGSSSYGSDAMRGLLDAIISDCAEMGIDTMPLKDIMLLRNENDLAKKGEEG